MTKDEALKMAIEAMNSAYSNHGLMLQSNPAQDAWLYHGCDAKLFKALQACKEALEQPAQEPVGWNEEEFNAIAYAYRAFPSSEVKMVSEKYKALVDYVLSIANHAPSWQGLSNDEIQEELKKMWDKGLIPSYSIVAFARAIEQALKDKNL